MPAKTSRRGERRKAGGRPRAAARPESTVKTLLDEYGRTLAEELGIDLKSNRSRGLFQLLVVALVSSARIGHEIALESARILFRRGWTTPEKMAASTWQQRVDALDEGGYVRYDERTSTMLEETARILLDRYEGDLGKLRDAADRDPSRERRLLKEFKGIGEVGVDIFFREVQILWPEIFPFTDKRVLATANSLGLGSDPQALFKRVRSRPDFARLVAALARVRLENKLDDVREHARAA